MNEQNQAIEKRVAALEKILSAVQGLAEDEFKMILSLQEICLNIMNDNANDNRTIAQSTLIDEPTKKALLISAEKVGRQFEKLEHEIAQLKATVVQDGNARKGTGKPAAR